MTLAIAIRSAGPPEYRIALTGSAITSHAGSVIAPNKVALTGKRMTATAGSILNVIVSANVNITLTGKAATFATGSLGAPAHTNALTGSVITGRTGTPFIKPLVITTPGPTLPAANVGTAYSFTFTATGGVPPYSFQLNSASPDTGSWMTLNASTGTLTGTPTVGETESLQLLVTDKRGISVTADFTMVVSGAFDSSFFLANSFQGITFNVVSVDNSSNKFTLCQFSGTDSKYGDVLPRTPASLWGGGGGSDSVQQLYSLNHKDALGLSTDIVDSIITDNTVPAGVSNKVRQCTLINPYNGNDFNQNSYIHFPGTAAQGMAYESLWIWLQGDLSNGTLRTGGGNKFAEVVEFKTPGSTNVERFQIGWWMTNWTGSGANVPTWVLFHDDANGSKIYMEDILGISAVNSATSGRQTHAAPVPQGQWFRLEWAFNRKDASNLGWMWMALTIPGHADSALANGVQVFAARGAFNHTDGSTVRTLGLNPGQPTALIGKLFIDNCSYTDIVRSSSSTWAVKTTDIQVYNHWPTTATAHPSNYL